MFRAGYEKFWLKGKKFYAAKIMGLKGSRRYSRLAFKRASEAEGYAARWLERWERMRLLRGIERPSQ
jgi:hypothetical protein